MINHPPSQVQANPDMLHFSWKSVQDVITADRSLKGSAIPLREFQQFHILPVNASFDGEVWYTEKITGQQTLFQSLQEVDACTEDEE